MHSPRLQIDIEKRLSNFNLRVNLSLESEILVLFGPSGAGKTQTLNAIAGLITPDRGEILFDGTTLFRSREREETVNLPARLRHIGYVFQHYALFPHMTALQNVAYPLKGDDAGGRALELLCQMNLDDLAGRYPHELSGGQQQRVAIARALAAESKVLLLDEPFSALDQSIRQRLHDELRALQSRTGLVVLYVTHNLEDALTVGNRLAIIHHGRIEQVGTIDEIFRSPRNTDVMEILGLPNIFQARVVEASKGCSLIDWKGLRMAVNRELSGETVSGYILPTEIELTDSSRCSDSDGTVPGTVISLRHSTTHHRLTVRLANGCELDVAIGKVETLRPGSTICLRIKEDGVIVAGTTIAR